MGASSLEQQEDFGPQFRRVRWHCREVCGISAWNEHDRAFAEQTPPALDCRAMSVKNRFGNSSASIRQQRRSTSRIAVKRRVDID